ncbi:DUF421 domain-containing protein [Larkinella knui]|uniref:DUF421 domain-containing protein n=1 Tax=Larkinella knui TaxID=2025310 RepID=A0A3P1CXR7_9BACT|nr:YetF domain-containing protein [Larkinella knui]RRB18141.1 DUF421 domain-containing protein [Larkinella knui]
MEKEEIHLKDWPRILVGEVPGIFYVEILIRVAAVYLILVVSMRLMGRRMASQLSRNEMAALISLAAAIGVPILDPNRGIIPAVIIALVVILVQQLISYWAAKNERFEGISQDIVSTMVENSVLQLDNMKNARLTRELLFAQLRSSGLTHLGSVKRLYLEANGAFTLIPHPKTQPGLSILPEWDTEFVAQQHQVPGMLVCHHCGNLQAKTANDKAGKTCSNCGKQKWVPAIQ